VENLVQILLQLRHVGNKVLDLTIRCLRELKHDSVEVNHLHLDALQSLPQNVAKVGIVPWNSDRVMDFFSSLHLHFNEVLRHLVR